MTNVAPQDHQIHHMGCGLRANIQAEQHTEESIHFIAAGERVQKMEQSANDDCKQNQSPHRFFIAVFRNVIHFFDDYIPIGFQSGCMLYNESGEKYGNS